MPLRPKAKNRFIRVALTLVAVAVCGGGAYVWRNHALEVSSRQSYADGLKLLESKEYEPALHQIGRYVQRHPNDPEALLAYARARMQVPLPNNKHFSDALGFLRRVLDVEPGNRAAATELLGLYERVNFNTEALTFAERVLQSRPADVDALRARAGALARLRHFDHDEALGAVNDLLKVAPDDLAGHLLALDILRNSDHTPQRLGDYAKQLRATRHDDALSVVLSGTAATLGGDLAGGKHWSAQAVGMTIDTLPLARLLQRQCDQLGMYAEATAVVQRYAAGRTDPESVALMTARLYEQQHYADVLALLARPGSTPDSQTRALCGLSAHEMKDQRVLDEQVAALGKLGTAEMPEPWYRVLKGLFAAGQADDGEIIRGCQGVLASDASNAYAELILSEAYARVGEADDSLQALRRAANLSPAWPAPYVKLARAALSLGRPLDAERLAQQAVDRDGTNIDALIALAGASVTDLKPGDREGAEKAQALLARIDQLAGPDDRWRSLPLRMQVMAAAGDRQGAVALGQHSFGSTPPPSAGTLMQVAAVSRAFELGLDDEALGWCERLHGITPDLAFIKAKECLDAGKRDEGLAVIEGGRSKAGAADPIAWDTARARFLDLAQDPKAKAAWMELADAHPQDARLQWLAVASSAMQSDRAFVGKVLDRLREQLGNGGLAWRLARAQWLLQDSDSQAAVQAALILNDITRGQPDLLAPRLLLADCLLRLHEESGAIDQLTVATNLQPQSVPIALKLAQLLQSRGDTARARIHLDRVLANPAARPDERRAAAQLVASSGDSGAALQAMEQARAAGDDMADPRTALFMAQLYWSSANPRQVEALCPALLNSPTPQTIAFVADFYASTGRKAQAQSVIGKLDAVAATPALKAVVRGQYEVQYGDTSKGIAVLKQATTLEGADATVWKSLIRGQASVGKLEDALASAASGSTVLHEPPGFRLLVARGDALKSVAQRWPEAVEICLGLLDQPDSDPAVGEVLDELRLIGRQSLSAGEEATRIARLATRHDQFLPLQAMAARRLLAARMPVEAASLAARAMSAWPDDARIAEIASISFAAGERWDDVVRTAKDWRRRIPANPLPADVLIATAQVRLNYSDQALAQLASYLPQVPSDPEKFLPAAVVTATAELKLGQTKAAEALLRPYLHSSWPYRLNWMQLAGTAVPKLEDARRWLADAAAAIDPAQSQESLLLAEGYVLVAHRFASVADVAPAKQIADRLVGKTDLPAIAYTSLGQIEETANDTKAAEGCYRQAITRDGKAAIAQNNLAMILLSEHRDLDAASDFAQAASSASGPNRAEYLDTLASVQFERGMHVLASKTLDEAVKLLPDRADWRLKQVRWYLASDNRAAAKAAADALQKRPMLITSLPVEERQEIDAVLRN